MKEYSYDFALYFGSIPMIDFLESLSAKERALIYKNIEKLVEYKNKNYNISDKFSKPLEGGIFELKVRFRDRVSRSLYFYEKDRMIVFTNGFVKKSQKTPRKEIEKAKSIREAYKND
ncbi:MAG: type II toxin-antitoxin system RelE/ParE family toxin [Campylobacterales bacterium]